MRDGLDGDKPLSAGDAREPGCVHAIADGEHADGSFGDGLAELRGTAPMSTSVMRTALLDGRAGAGDEVRGPTRSSTIDDHAPHDEHLPVQQAPPQRRRQNAPGRSRFR